MLDLAADDSIALHLIPEDVGWLVAPHFDRITHLEHTAVVEGGRASR